MSTSPPAASITTPTPRRRGASKHSTVAAQLLEQIRSGHFPPGARLPSEPDLCRHFGVSRHTVRSALRSLYEKGLVLSQQGRGTVVQTAAATPRYAFACNSVDDHLQYAASAPRELRQTSRRQVDPALAQWLGCGPGEDWWEMRTCRIEKQGQTVIAASRIYVPDRFAEAVAELATSPLPLFALIEQRYGHHIAQVRQNFSVAHATPDEATDLGLTVGAAVMCVERRFFDERGSLLEVSCSVHPPLGFRYEMTVRQIIGQGSA